MPASPAQIFASADILARAGDLSDWTATIFDFGETAWREYRSAAWYVERLRAEGFRVEDGSGGMPTAFCADWSNAIVRRRLRTAHRGMVWAIRPAGIPIHIPGLGLQVLARSWRSRLR
jgi:hypothetical protein